MNVSKTVMIHVAVEILAFSYLYSLVNKKTKSLEVEIEEIREDYEKKIDDLYEKVEILKNALLQITRPKNDSPVQSTQQTYKNTSQPPQQPKKNTKQQNPKESNTNNTFVLPPMFMSNPFELNFNEVKQAEVVEDNEENEENNKEEEQTEITDKEMEEIEQIINSSVE